MRSSAANVLAIVALAHLSGCCGLARFFCGPDKSPWVPVAFDSPEATLRTFLEAVRRDNPNVVYLCLARSFRVANQLDAVGVNAAWDRLREQTPGLHVLGYADVPPTPTIVQDRGVSYVLDVEGYTLRIDLVRQSYWEVLYHSADGRPQETSRTLDDTLNGLLVVQDDVRDPIDDLPQARLSLELRGIPHPYAEHLRLEAVDRVAIGREWKIANLVVPEE